MNIYLLRTPMQVYFLVVPATIIAMNGLLAIINGSKTVSYGTTAVSYGEYIRITIILETFPCEVSIPRQGVRFIRRRMHL